jgi:hypothetical protein
MSGYKPLWIRGNQTGLVQEREEMILPDDAYPVLENAFVWRERIKRKQGYQLLGRLQRTLTSQSLGMSSVSPWSFNIYSTLASPITGEPNAQINPGTVVITISTDTFTDQGNGTLKRQDGNVASTINYSTGDVVLVTLVGAAHPATITFKYFPGLPCMGLPLRNLNATLNRQTVSFDTKYAYIYTSGWGEFISGTTWTGSNSNFFWGTNYWVSAANNNLFWVTNFSGISGDPIRYTDGTTWTNFAPTIDASSNLLTQCLALLPFRGRLLAFNTLEGTSLALSVAYRQRIRWSAIGSPLTMNAWRDDIVGQGGFLDIPTLDNIVSVGFVRDNLVIYCTHSTWQLRYTGRTIQPFQIEKVNSELGAESTFSVIQFDTSLAGIGDKGVVQCDSYSSKLIDIKIPDLVFHFNQSNNGTQRIQGVRDFIQRLAFWIYPYVPGTGNSDLVYPNRRLVYNYENDSWAIFTDSLTALGTFQEQGGRTWTSTPTPWNRCNFPWISQPLGIPDIIGGNQQGFIEYLDAQTSNDVSLWISAITGNTTTPTVITSPDHNLETGDVIAISGIPLGTPFANSLNNPLQGLITAITQANPGQVTSTGHNLTNGTQVEFLNVGGMTQLNGNIYTITVVDANNFKIGIDTTNYGVYTSGGTWEDQAVNAFGIVVVDADNFELYKYSPQSQDFTTPQLDAPATYVGGGLISVRDNFYIQSKKFNYLDEGQNIQMGYIDVLMDSTDEGAISLNVFLNYNVSQPVNTLPDNDNPKTNAADTFFNSVVPTTNTNPQGIPGEKYWQRIFCPVRGNFLTIVWTLSNAQMVGYEQESDVQIDSQVLWRRPAGRLTNF